MVILHDSTISYITLLRANGCSSNLPGNCSDEFWKLKAQNSKCVGKAHPKSSLWVEKEHTQKCNTKDNSETSKGSFVSNRLGKASLQASHLFYFVD
jgi:hypothetical protein